MKRRLFLQSSLASALTLPAFALEKDNPYRKDIGIQLYTLRNQLSKKPTQRGLNGIVAVQLLPIFERTPEAWRTLPYLNVGRGKKKQKFEDYLQAWHDNTPEPLRSHVIRITKEFKL